MVMMVILMIGRDDDRGVTTVTGTMSIAWSRLKVARQTQEDLPGGDDD